MRTALSYTMSRLILFVVVLLLLDLAGARGLLLIALALLISGLLSYVLLSRQRDAMAGSLGQRLLGRSRDNSFRARLAEGARAEDTDDSEPVAADSEPVADDSEPAAASPEPPAGQVSPADNR